MCGPPPDWEDERVPDAPDPMPRLDPATVTLDEVEQRLLGAPATIGRSEVSREAQVSLDAARRFWHAMGFPRVADEDAVFTEADRAALDRVARLVESGQVDERLALEMTRAFARTADRLAVWQTQLLAESLTPREDEAALGESDARAVPQRRVAEEAAVRLVELVDATEPLLLYVWRRHLSGAIGRMLADARADDHSDASAPPRVVGFADLVSFTSLVRRMTERQLAALVQHFEHLATNVVTTHGGRVIKTVGDEVLFVHTDAAAGAAIALDLVDAMAEDELLPDVRVGMAWGRVVSRLGDIFGTTVNRASRLTSTTPSGRVWIDDELSRRLDVVSGFTLIPQRRRVLRGIGLVTPAELRRSSGVRARPSDQHT